MKTSPRVSPVQFAATVAVLLFAFVCGSSLAADSKVTLSGANEVPPNSSAATGSGSFTIGADKSVSGSVTAKGMTPTAAHIHMAAPGVNGPVIVPLTQADNTFSTPAGAKLTDEQYAAYLAGNLYVNVHSKAFPGGEIRAQLTK
jgi:CHRD domain-containing protein